MVDAVKSIAGRFGAVCYADPFLPTAGAEDSVLTRAMGWLAAPTSRPMSRPRDRREQSMQA
jgi:hypothetical protein